MNFINVLWRRFQRCLGTFTMLLVEGSSETALFRHLSDSVFGVRNFENTKSMRVIFFSKDLKFNINFQNAANTWEKYLWTGIVKLSKLSLLRTGYFSLAANVLSSSTKHLYQIHWSLPSHLNWKKSLLLTCQISVLLVNTLAADEKYLVLNRDKLTIPIEMHFSKKEKTFSELFATFIKSTLNFKHFEKKWAW